MSDDKEKAIPKFRDCLAARNKSAIGLKVVYTGKNGLKHHRDHANEHLVVGSVYTIHDLETRNWSTRVWLEELEGDESFNSVHFVDEDDGMIFNMWPMPTVL